jgi:hypothetical protein
VLSGVPRPMPGKTDFDRSGRQLMARQSPKQDRCQRRMDLAARWWLNGRGDELIDLAKALLISPISLKRRKTRPRSRR